MALLLTIHFFCNVLTHHVAKEDSKNTIYLDWFLFPSTLPFSRTLPFDSSILTHLQSDPIFFFISVGFSLSLAFETDSWWFSVSHSAPISLQRYEHCMPSIHRHDESCSSSFNGWIDDRLHILCPYLHFIPKLYFIIWLGGFDVALLRTQRPL